jgi:hypothetical protein
MAFLRTPAAADYLQSKYGIGAAKTLNRYRVIGVGPPFHKFGRLVVYAPADLDAWAEAKMGPLQRCTSDAPKRAAKKANQEIAAE